MNIVKIRCLLYRKRPYTTNLCYWKGIVIHLKLFILLYFTSIWFYLRYTFVESKIKRIPKIPVCKLENNAVIIITFFVCCFSVKIN